MIANCIFMMVSPFVKKNGHTFNGGAAATALGRYNGGHSQPIAAAPSQVCIRVDFWGGRGTVGGFACVGEHPLRFAATP
jgi:hypothetical protein